MSDEPTIPIAPTDPAPQEPDDESPNNGKKKGKDKGGRPSNADLAAENKRLAAENLALREALADFSAIPDDSSKPDDFVLYKLARSGRSIRLTSGHVRRARKLLQGVE
jgi:hypothetical protein